MTKEQKQKLQEALKEVNERLDKAYNSGKLNSDWLTKVKKK